jgi:cob(I)alamin adenosyltransferase
MSVRINRVYTRTGDQGETGLVGGRRVGKDSLRIECYGTVDELNAVLGVARLHSQGHPKNEIAALDLIFVRVQNELFNLGSMLATRAEDLRPTQPVIEPRHVEQLEHEIDRYNEGLPELRSFVLPGGGPLGAYLHLARTVCRRAERLAVALRRQEEVAAEAIRYLNRLSDALFVWARWAAAASATPEELWRPAET